MENIFRRFPDMGEAILSHINDKSLVLCKKVDGTWKNFIDEQKIIWIRMIEKHIGKSNTFPNDWKNVLHKTSVQMVSELAVTVQKF